MTKREMEQIRATLSGGQICRHCYGKGYFKGRPFATPERKGGNEVCLGCVGLGIEELAENEPLATKLKRYRLSKWYGYIS